MTLFNRLKLLFTNRFSSFEKNAAPANGYNLWAASYDDQPDNLMLALDEAVFSTLLKAVTVKDKMITDVGCGTGRHWKKISDLQPKKITGFDVSGGMLAILRKKFPSAETYLMQNNFLNPLQNESCDLLVSTLTIAHIENMQQALGEWSRVLKHGGNMIITDYHPTALAMGGKRTFNHNGKSVAVKNYTHSIEAICKTAMELNFSEINFIEKKIDDTVRHYYEKQNALKIFEQFKGTPIIYGLYFIKK